LMPEIPAENEQMQEEIKLREEAAPGDDEEKTGLASAQEEAASDRVQEEVLALKKELELAREEANRNYDQYLRALAEADNIKKRAQRERDEYIKFAALPLIKNLLTVLDDLERAVKMSDNQDYEVLIKGIEMITKKLQEILQAEGLKEIEALGKAFDPQFHEPLLMEKSDSYPENTVIEELQKGYTLHGRVIRPSLVKVSN
jgi:molecular chaperone GrpE